MTEDSLGRAVAITALAPIAEKLADQQEREDREAERRRAEQETAERERADREDRIRSGVATSADLDEVAREAAYELARVDANQVWTGLVASGAVGAPTHDVLEVHVKGKNSRLTLTELSRVPAWLAPSAGEWEGHGLHQIDAWVDCDGVVWIPSTPHPQDYEEFYPDRDNRGSVYGPRPLMVLLPHGAGLRMKKTRGKWSAGQVAEGIVLARETGPMRNRHGLHEAVVAILEARGFGPPVPAP